MRVWDEFVTEQDKEVYRSGGFGGRGGLSSKAAMLVIDALYQSIGDRPEPVVESVKRFPASCGEEGWRAIACIQRLLGHARAAGVPVLHCIPVEREPAEAGRYADKMPAIIQRYRVGSHDSLEIVEEVAPAPGERIVRKPKSSAFFGTELREIIAELGVDTVVLTGCTTSGCVRLTAADAFQHDLRAIVVEEAVYDRGQASHAVNLWDINAKYADVVSLDDAAAYFERLGEARASSARRNL